MKNLAISLLAGTALLGFASASYAADLIIEEPVEVGVVDVGGNWDGVFIGGFIGGGWGVADHTSLVPGNDMDLSGWLIGVNAGANFTLTDGIVAGIVGDIAWSNISGEIVGGPRDGTTHTINWQGSVRGRLGFDGGAFMPYVTGGLAFAQATRLSDGNPNNTADATHIGWTVGAGVEFAVADNVSVDLLYRYSDLGEEVYDWSGAGTNPTIDLNTHTITAGLNWSF